MNLKLAKDIIIMNYKFMLYDSITLQKQKGHFDPSQVISVAHYAEQDYQLLQLNVYHREY